MIETDFAPFVDDDEDAGKFGRAQQLVQQRRLASAQKAGDDADRNWRFMRHFPVGKSLPTNTGAPEGAPVGEPPGGSTVTA